MAKQTKELAAQSIKGTKSLVNRAEKRLALVKRAKESSGSLFTGNAYLPLTQGLIGCTIRNLADLGEVLVYARTLIGSPPKKNLWLPYLGETLDAGIAALLAMEVLEFLESVDVSERRDFWTPLGNDAVKIHSRNILGEASIVLALGTAENPQAAASLVREIKERHTYIFMAGNNKDQTLAHQLETEGITLGWDAGLIPLGPRTSNIIHAFSFFVQVALFEGLSPGKARDILQFVKDKIFAFMMILGEADREKYAAVAGAISFGIQSVAEFYIPQLLPIYPLA